MMQKVRKPGLLAAVAAILCSTATGQTVTQDDPVVVEGPVSQAIYVSADEKAGHDRYGYAGAHRAGDFLFVSGVVVGSWDGDLLDVEGLKEAARRGFRLIGERLEAADADFSQVVDLVTYHIWDTEYFDGDKAAQLQAIVDVKREFMDEPDPAWTAVGTTGLVPDRGIVEIRVIAYVPQSD